MVQGTTVPLHMLPKDFQPVAGFPDTLQALCYTGN